MKALGLLLFCANAKECIDMEHGFKCSIDCQSTLIECKTDCSEEACEYKCLKQFES